MADTEGSRSTDLGGAQAQAAPWVEPVPDLTERYTDVARELLGIDDDFKLQTLVEPRSVINSTITNAAHNIITDYSEMIEIDGSDYHVSLGNEHFADTPGIFDELARDELFGFRLVQRVSNSRDEEYEPIYLIANGDVDISTATLQDSSKSIMVNNSSELPDDPEALRSLAILIAAIGRSSKARTERRQIERAAIKSESHKRHGKHIRRAIGGIVLAGAVTFGALNVPDQYHSWKEQRQEQQAEVRIEERQKQMQLAERERQARLAREAKVREFDKSYQLSKDINVSTTDEPIAAQVTDQFVDVDVPNYNAQDIAPGLAHDIVGSPRAINISNYTEADGSGYRAVRMNIREGEKFHVKHNGSKDDLIVVELDAKDDVIRITDYGPLRGSNATQTEATQIFIEKVAG